MPRIFIVNASPSVISFAPVKALLGAADVTQWPASSLIGLRLLMPEHPVALAALGEASLTDAARAHDQIRFFLHERVERNFRDIASAWAAQYAPAHIVVGAGAHLDEGSRQFFTMLTASHPEVTVQLGLDTQAAEATHTHEPTDFEAGVATGCRPETVIDEAGAGELTEAARRYLSVGDAWTALNILNVVIEAQPSAVAWSCLGLAYAMLGRTYEAEYCYLQWRREPAGPERANADYALAMLYARHHPAHVRSLEQAAEYLLDGRDHLSRLDPADVDNLDFHKVFNKNGYALIQFRRGETAQAIAELRDGIATLEATGSSRNYMHKTVLIYNLAQCFRRTGDLFSAIDTYQRLLAVDSNMPEYHMELAQCQLELRQADQALGPLLEARRLGPSIGEVHSLLGYCYVCLDRMPEAVESYRQAHQISPADPALAYDYAFALADLGQPTQALAVTQRFRTDDLPPALARDIAAIKAEQLSLLGLPEAAEAELLAVLRRLPGDEQTRQNLDLIRSMTRAA